MFSPRRDKRVFLNNLREESSSRAWSTPPPLTCFSLITKTRGAVRPHRQRNLLSILQIYQRASLFHCRTRENSSGNFPCNFPASYGPENFALFLLILSLSLFPLFSSAVGMREFWGGGGMKYARKCRGEILQTSAGLLSPTVPTTL